MICVHHWFSEPGDPPEPVPPQPVEPVHPKPVPPQLVKPVSPQPVKPVSPQPVEPVSPQPVEPVPPQPVLSQPVEPVQPEPVPPQPVDPGMYMHILYVYSHTIIDSPSQAVPLDHLYNFVAMESPQPSMAATVGPPLPFSIFSPVQHKWRQ